MKDGERPARARQGGPRAAVRVLIVLLLTAGTLHLLSLLLPGFVIDGKFSALVAAAAIGMVNALVWPLLIRVALPFTVLTLGLGVLVLNGAVVVLRVSQLDRASTSTASAPAIVVAVGVTVVNTLATVAARHRRRRLLLPQRRQAAGQARQRRPTATRRSRASTSSRSTASPTMWSGARSATATCRISPRWLRDGSPPAAALGDRLVVADRRLPGRPAARRQRRHAGVSLVGEGSRHARS